MSLFTTMNTAASGLGAQSASLSVIGDNIANIGTTGFKGSRIQFADFLPQDSFGLSGPTTVGTGAGVDTVATLFGQGSLETSSNALDMAISGSGFFIVSDGFSDYYTRAGEFYLDDDGYVVTASGLTLQGYSARNGDLGATVGDLRIDLGTSPPSATSSIVLTANLDSEASANEDEDSESYGTPLTDGSVDIASGTGATLEEAANAADFATSVTVYDSLGQAHEVTICFEQTDTGAWNYWAVVDAGEVTDGSSTFTEGRAYTIASGELEFDTEGDLTSFTQTDTSGWNFLGADTSSFSFDFGLDASGSATHGGLTQVAGDSTVTSLSQDGYPPGDLSSISVGEDGTITGAYTNGEELELGQVVLADFPAEAGLERLGANLFRATVGSGDPAIGIPDTGGRGSLAGNALEASNVELEEQFVDMISTQRSYQANARVIGTADDTLAELVQLV